MDYRTVDEIETDYGVLHVIARVENLGTMQPVALWLEHRGYDKSFSVQLDAEGGITPESEAELAKKLREMREGV